MRIAEIGLLVGSRGRRVAVAVVIGVICGLTSFASTLRVGFNDQDFRIFWVAARILLGGGNPYTMIVFSQGGPGYFSPLLTGALVTPLAPVPVTIAGPIFVAISCGLLAFALTREGWWRLLAFVSGSMYVAVVAANWAPIMTFAVLTPAAAWLGAARPNVGLAILAAQPSVRTAVRPALLMGLVSVACLAILPTWPLDWLSVVRESRLHFAPILSPGGFVLALAALKWRRSDARFLLVLSCVPSSPIVYEALPLFTIPRQWTEMAVLSVSTLIAFFARRPAPGATEAFVHGNQLLMVVTCYLPALVMVLSRPNVSVLPTVDHME